MGHEWYGIYSKFYAMWIISQSIKETNKERDNTETRRKCSENIYQTQGL